MGTKVQLMELEVGAVFKIGDHDFIVLEQTEGQTAVISKGFMADDVVFDEYTRDYNKSNLKNVIESEIQPVIEEAVGAENLIEHEVGLTSVDMQNEFGSCRCKARPITFDEARKYNNLIVNKDLDGWWWTLTPWSTEDRGWKWTVTVVSPVGDVYGNRCDCIGGVHPLCILKSDIFVSKGE